MVPERVLDRGQPPEVVPGQLLAGPRSEPAVVVARVRGGRTGAAGRAVGGVVGRGGRRAGADLTLVRLGTASQP